MTSKENLLSKTKENYNSWLSTNRIKINHPKNVSSFSQLPSWNDMRCEGN